MATPIYESNGAQPTTEGHDYIKGLDEKAHTPSNESVEMAHAPGLTKELYEGKPTEEERKNLRRVPGSLPLVVMLICAVEFAERASYYGVSPLINVR